MSNCFTCAHWDRKGQEYAYDYTEEKPKLDNKSTRTCLKVIQLNKYNTEKSDFEGVKAYVVDASGYHAALWTRGDFYCSLYQSTAPYGEK